MFFTPQEFVPQNEDCDCDLTQSFLNEIFPGPVGGRVRLQDVSWNKRIRRSEFKWNNDDAFGFRWVNFSEQPSSTTSNLPLHKKTKTVLCKKKHNWQWQLLMKLGVISIFDDFEGACLLEWYQTKTITGISVWNRSQKVFFQNLVFKMNARLVCFTIAPQIVR